MAVETKTVHVHTCDRCKKTWEGGVTESVVLPTAYSDLTWQYSVRAYDGSMGGTKHVLWLCDSCTSAFGEFLKSRPEPAPESLPERMRQAADILEEATKLIPGTYQPDPTQHLWRAANLRYVARQLEQGEV